jgi:chromate transporter
MLAYPTAIGQVLIIMLAGLVGWWWLAEASAPRDPGLHVSIGHRGAAVAWGIFFGLLIGLPVMQQWVHSVPLAVFDSFFRVGSLVFGGGHVVLPLLQVEVVPPGWVTNEQFVAGYGAAQAVPGPLFTFAAYLGAVMRPLGGGLAGAALALVAVFAPSFLLIVGALPLWDSLRPRPGFQAALRGINAAVVGLLLAALYHPVWTSAIHAPADVALGLVDFGLLVFWKWPPWLVVILSALGGAALAHL